jgi:hypothetical protein
MDFGVEYDADARSGPLSGASFAVTNSAPSPGGSAQRVILGM